MQTLAGKGVSGLWPAVLRAACSASALSRSFSSWLLCTFMFSPSLPSCRGHSTSQHETASLIVIPHSSIEVPAQLSMNRPLPLASLMNNAWNNPMPRAWVSI